MEQRWLVAAACCCILGQMAASMQDETGMSALDDSDDEDGQSSQRVGGPEAGSVTTANMEGNLEMELGSVEAADDTGVQDMQALSLASRSDEHHAGNASTRVTAHELASGHDNTSCKDLASHSGMRDCSNTSSWGPFQRSVSGSKKDDVVQDSQQQAGAADVHHNRVGLQRGVMEWYLEFARRLLLLLGIVEHK
jgi:hypothetical protein